MESGIDFVILPRGVAEALLYYQEEPFLCWPHCSSSRILDRQRPRFFISTKLDLPEITHLKQNSNWNILILIKISVVRFKNLSDMLFLQQSALAAFFPNTVLVIIELTFSIRVFWIQSTWSMLQNLSVTIVPLPRRCRKLEMEGKILRYSRYS